jgi:4-amino-4-deoxy-L-arabinose transferase-like glycosyltransferase
VLFAGLALLLVSVNWIGGRLFSKSTETPSPGTIAALLAVCYHFPAWLIHDAFLDYLLMAMVALAFALLLLADGFHVRSRAVLFGAVAGLGMLEKQTFLFFFVLPLAFLGIRALWCRDRRAIMNLSLSMAVMAHNAATVRRIQLGRLTSRAQKFRRLLHLKPPNLLKNKEGLN